MNSAMALAVAMPAGRTRNGCHGTVGLGWLHHPSFTNGPPVHQTLGLHDAHESAQALFGATSREQW
jgi:hypothetical protein